MICPKCGTTDNGTNFQVGKHLRCPADEQPAPKPKKPCKVDTENFRVPLGDICGQEIKPEDIDSKGFHRGCPGTWVAE